MPQIKTFLIGSELERVDTEEQVIYIKGHYFIDRNKEDYAQYDSDDQGLQLLKDSKVAELQEQYNIDDSKLSHKVTFRVLLPFCIISAIHYMTRFAIAVASQVGLKEDLGLTDSQYNLATAVFFIPYVIFELLSNLLLKYIRPHYFMTFYVFMLGVTVLCNGFVTSFSGIIVCRFFTGLFQSNSSALYYILANYYPNHKSQKVYTAYYSFGTAGGLLSFLLVKVADKIDILSRWSWIFIFEGILTILLSIPLFFFIPDFPEGARFLDDDETIYLVKKLEVYGGKSGYQLRVGFKDVLAVLSDPLLWWGTLAYLGVLGCSYSYAYFEPTIVQALTDDIPGSNKLLLEGIPFAISIILANIFAWLSDYVEKRAPFALIGALLAFAGLILMESNPTNNTVRYYGCSMAVVGLSCTIPVVVCWVTMNFGGHLRKNVATAWMISFASTAGIFSNFLFTDADAPQYRTGIWANIVFLSVSFLFMIIYMLSLLQENKKKTSAIYREHFDALSSREKTFLGDKSPSFKYML
ncbi:hypothetical protein DASC09_046350 [Saccharomycopsis crataegensis]|uniref:Major facilitator superfamily (MFS) profile domain-containing protein n=1 Tax=Saccharomycopsis crataegensis TaxID=43959 RepID=A0AAV5QSS5_9ASCO|nr:hypothetical protein DASC09_046350 [Saccharomycopsis crataegensis]